MIEVTLLGTGSPIVDPNRAGPSTLVRAGDSTFLVDCGRGALMRAAAVGVGAADITALLLTHLHSDHITDLSDVITTRWVNTFTRTPLPLIGPPGTAAVVEATLAALAPDISYRIAHHADITEPPVVEVHEYTDGPVWDEAGVIIRVAPTWHRPVEPTIGFRVEFDGASVVLAGDTIPCESLDA
jgi:ribonuclease Z